jgi:hypothetical protein
LGRYGAVNIVGDNGFKKRNVKYGMETRNITEKTTLKSGTYRLDDHM